MIQLDSKFFPSDMQARAETLLPKAHKALLQLRDHSCLGGEFTGWFDWPRQRGQALWREVKEYIAKLDVYYDTVVVVGIGGSYLGTRAVADALGHEYGVAFAKSGKNARRPVVAYAGHHLSEAGLVELLDLLEERQPVINVISKSGTTTEPAVHFRVLRSYMEKRFGKTEAARRIIATTDAHKGALRKLADENGYRTFEVPDDVGGRYSVLTAVGLVPLALAGFDCERLLAGADSVFKELREGNAEGHAVLRYAAYRNAAYEVGKKVELLSTGEPKLRNLIEWWKQLFGESEGKDGKGLFPAGLIYTTDLHSMGQYVQEGERDLLETFLLIEHPTATAGDGTNVERRIRIPHGGGDLDGLAYLEQRFVGEINAAALLGTKVAHADGGVPCLSVTIPRLDEHNLGALFAFFETACGVSGAVLGVNPYDQPGVEAYKKNLFGLLGKPGFEDLGAALRKRL
jgi:glucose-6-phosphate isomerase